MKSFRIARVWFGIATVVGALAVAGPTAGRIDEGPSDGLRVVSSPDPGVYGNIVWGLAARTAADVWAVGVKATVPSNDTLAMHWNGTSWAVVPTPNPVPECQDGDIYWNGNSLNAAAAVSGTDVWAVGSECYSMNTLLEHWNGTGWSIVQGPRLFKGAGLDEFASLYGVAAISSSDVWAVGYRAPGGIQPLIEHYDGVSWRVVSAARPVGGGDSYLTGVSGSGPSDVWAVGVGDHSNLIEHWDGTSWSTVATPQPVGRSSLEAVKAISRTEAWAVGSKRASSGGTATFILHWNGSTWSEVASPNPSAGADATNVLRSVAAVSAGNVWAVGMYHNDQTNFHQRRTLTLHWNGISWSIVPSATPGRSGELNGAVALSKGQVFASGLYSEYDVNIYDGHYTLPQTLVMHG
jgi:hypothetical protein